MSQDEMGRKAGENMGGQVDWNVDRENFMGFIDSLVKEQDELQQSLQKKEGELADTQAALSAAQSAFLGQKEQFATERRNTSEQLQQLQKVAEDRKHDLDGAKSRLRDVNSQLSAMRAEQKEKDAALGVLQVENRKLSKKLQAMTAAAIVMGILLLTGISVLSYLLLNRNRELNRVQATGRAIQSDYNSLEEEHGQLEQTYAALKGDHEQLEQTYAALKGDHEELEQTYNTLEQNYNEMITKCKAAEDKAKDLDKDYKDLKEDYKELYAEYNDIIDILDEPLGYGSKDFYSNKSVVVLEQGDSEQISIYGSMNTTYSMLADSDTLDVQWVGDFVGKMCNVSITGTEEGCYTVLFTNKQNKDQFSVLVIVR